MHVLEEYLSSRIPVECACALERASHEPRRWFTLLIIEETAKEKEREAPVIVKVRVTVRRAPSARATLLRVRPPNTRP